MGMTPVQNNKIFSIAYTEMNEYFMGDTKLEEDINYLTLYDFYVNKKIYHL